MKTRNAIIHWGLVLLFTVVVGVVVGVEYGVAYIVKDVSQVATNATCAPKQLDKVWYSHVYLTMDCNGGEFYSTDEATIIAWGNERKIPACTLFKSGRAKCVEETQG